MPDPLVISELEAAALLGIPKGTLRNWRTEGKGPAFIRMGDGPRPRPAYRKEDLVAWIEARRHVPGASSEPAAASPAE